jgi:acetoin utilization deacetylase AcuC-like enzyme
MSTGLIYDPKFLEHDTGPHHPERPDRLRAIVDRLKAHHQWDRFVHLPFKPATVADVTRLHDAGYVERLRQACERGETYIDVADSAIGPHSFDIGLLAVGGAFAAVDAVMAGRVTNAFGAVRPPGHHAERDRSMGFCLFNNIALAAERLLSKHGLERVAIVDFDVHHGNGTQHLFEHTQQVLFISLHEHPVYLYPGTGFGYETGKDTGQGYTLNVTLEPGSGDEAFRSEFLRKVLPAIDRYEPQFVLISAGFDASADDPLAHLKATPDGFAWMTRQLKQCAEMHCQGRLVSLLEGGYDLRSLSECVSRHVDVLLADAGHDDLMAMKAGLL